MIVSKKSWHFKSYNWFNEGKLPNIIDLCSYCRTVFFWTPLKAIFYSPAAWLHKKSKLLSYLILVLLVGATDVLLAIASGGWVWPYIFTIIILYLFIYLPRLNKTVSSDWNGAENTKFVRYTKKTGNVIGTGLNYFVGLPLKTIFWTVWVKMYNWHKALFWIVLPLAVAAIFYGLYLIGGLWTVLIIIATLALIFALIFLFVWLLGKTDLGNNLVWQFLLAQKRKICPFIEPKD